MSRPNRRARHDSDDRLIEGSGTLESRWLSSSTIQQMPTLDIAQWPQRYKRIWILTPHPDDEVLGLGGTLARLSMLCAEVWIVSVTDGEASHPGSTVWSRSRLAVTRRIEMERAHDVLGLQATILRLGLPDGGIAGKCEDLLRTLSTLVEEEDLVLTTSTFDGHPDHEACGEVAARLVVSTGVTVYEYPVWMWHWAVPQSAAIPWARARRICIDEAQLSRKIAAIRVFSSQTNADGPRDAVLPPNVIARFVRPFEVVFV